MTTPFPIIWTGVTGANEMMIVGFLGFWGIVGMGTSVCGGNEIFSIIESVGF